MGFCRARLELSLFERTKVNSGLRPKWTTLPMALRVTSNKQYVSLCCESGYDVSI
jgi:hypothetical protein